MEELAIHNSYFIDETSGFQSITAVDACRHETNKRFRVFLIPVTWQKLLSLEIPLLILMSGILSASVLFTPSLEPRFAFFDVSFPSVTSSYEILDECLVLGVFGIPCIFCGATRSFSAMGGMDIHEAFIFHPLGPVLFLVSVFVFICLSYSLVTRKHIKIYINQNWSIYSICSMIILLWIAWPLKIIIWKNTGLL